MEIIDPSTGRAGLTPPAQQKEEQPPREADRGEGETAKGNLKANSSKQNKGQVPGSLVRSGPTELAPAPRVGRSVPVTLTLSPPLPPFRVTQERAAISALRARCKCRG